MVEFSVTNSCVLDYHSPLSICDNILTINKFQINAVGFEDSITKQTILIVEDEDVFRNFLGISLTSEGYETVEAEN